ncbi:MAG: HEAT repeat domain-containing protein [Myxococcaceae bacterium]|nr:HEAT repeat domain-containing protein [Myxococcaceae bacterium]
MYRWLAALSVFGMLALCGCKGDPSTPAYWEKSLSTKGKKEKLRAIEELRSANVLNKTFLPMLHQRLNDEKSAEVKAKIALLLGELKDPSSIEPMTNAIEMNASESDARQMNREIATALANTGDAKVAGTLLKLMKTKDNYTVIDAIEGLGTLRAKEAVEPLIELATSDSTEPFITKKAIQALGNIGDPKAVPALIKMMFRERKGISFYMESSFALYQIGPVAGDALLAVLGNQNKELTQWAEANNILAPALHAKAAQVLGDLHDKRAEKLLIEKLGYNNEMMDIKLFVRMRMADALGRMRSKDGAKALAGMLDEEEANTRNEYIRALVKIGSHDAVPAMLKAAGKGSWDARETVLRGLGMLGGEAELPALDKLEKEEEKIFAAECKADPEYEACKDPKASVAQHVAVIRETKKRIAVAKECKSDAKCWEKKLDDADTGIRERAAYEIGRSGDVAMVDVLTKRLAEKNLDARLAIIQATDWLVTDSKEAAKQAAKAVPALEKQIADEKGKTEFVKVNEDLRRLLVLLKRSAA